MTTALDSILAKAGLSPEVLAKACHVTPGPEVVSRTDPTPQAPPRRVQPATRRPAPPVPAPQGQHAPSQENHRRPESTRQVLDVPVPANIDAEKTILGAILLDNAAYADAAEHIKPDDFSLDSHRRISLRMSELIAAGRAVDIVTLADVLKKHKEIESIGGVAYLASLTEGLPRRPVIGEYIRIVKDKSLLRRLMGIAANLTARAGDQSETAAKIGEWALGEVSRLVEAAGPDAGGLHLIHGNDIEDRDTPVIVPDHIPDEDTMGLYGPPGCGKTSVGMLIGADLSVGKTPFSGAPCEPRNILIMSNEDSASRIKKLFASAGGDLERLWVERIDDVWSLKQLPLLEASFKEHSIRYGLIDSLASHRGGADLNSKGDMTSLLIPLRCVAEKTRALIVVVHHTNKSTSGDPLQKVDGSLAIQCSIRHNVHIAVSPENLDARLFLNGVTHFFPPNVPALSFELAPLRWCGTSNLTVHEVYEHQAQQTAPQSSSAKTLERALAWLREILSDGQSHGVRELVEKATAADISRATLYRAAAVLNVKRIRGFGSAGSWMDSAVSFDPPSFDEEGTVQ